MLLQKSILGAFLVLAATAHAQEFKCPSSQGKSVLFTVVVYDGPPVGKADLAPDVSRGKTSYTFASWDVGYLYGMGHSVYLVCKFAGLGDAQAVTIKVDKKVRQCVFRADKGVPAEAVCK
ncbi:MAG: STY0301 family protein [Terracidiphilus sp.]